MTTIPPGEDLVLIGPNGTDFRFRVNQTNGELDLIYSDPSSGVSWVADTVIHQTVPVGMERSRAMRLDWLSLDSENPFEAGGALDTTTLALSRRVVGRVPHKYDALWSMVFVGSATSAGVLDQQYGAVAARVWDTTLDANGHAQGELRIAGNGFEHQGLMGLARGAVLTDAENQPPAGGDCGYMGFGAFNVPGGYFVDGHRVDRTPISFGSADLISPGQTRYYGCGYSTTYPSGAFFLTPRAGWIRNLSVRLPSMPGGAVHAVLQRQYQDTTMAVTLSGTQQNGQDAQHPILVGPGEAIGLRVSLDGACVPQGSMNATFEFGA